MNSIKDRADLIAAAAKKMGKEVFNDNLVKNSTPRYDLQRQNGKVVTLVFLNEERIEVENITLG